MRTKTVSLKEQRAKTMFFCLCSLFFVFLSCNQAPVQTPANRQAVDSTSLNLLEMNRILAEREQKEILQFIEEKGWKMEVSPIGFWYEIREQGTGKPFVKNDLGHIEYSLSMLDGTQCAENAPLIIKKGAGEEPRGIDEALGMLREGGSGRFIIPSNLAYGVLGNDDRCVKSHAAIVYEVKILEIR
jgi:FKBP-type peptidyl-prolyl cis-trans isomerase